MTTTTTTTTSRGGVLPEHGRVQRALFTGNHTSKSGVIGIPSNKHARSAFLVTINTNQLPASRAGRMELVNKLENLGDELWKGTGRVLGVNLFIENSIEIARRDYPLRNIYQPYNSDFVREYQCVYRAERGTQRRGRYHLHCVFKINHDPDKRVRFNYRTTRDIVRSMAEGVGLNRNLYVNIKRLLPYDPEEYISKEGEITFD